MRRKIEFHIHLGSCATILSNALVLIASISSIASAFPNGAPTACSLEPKHPGQSPQKSKSPIYFKITPVDEESKPNQRKIPEVIGYNITIGDWYGGPFRGFLIVRKKEMEDDKDHGEFILDDSNRDWAKVLPAHGDCLAAVTHKNNKEKRSVTVFYRKGKEHEMPRLHGVIVRDFKTYWVGLQPKDQEWTKDGTSNLPGVPDEVTEDC